jgi:hypothetical protein
VVSHVLIGGPRVQFCPRGHDTFIVGRGPQGRCYQCDRDRRKIRYYANLEENRRKSREASRFYRSFFGSKGKKAFLAMSSRRIPPSEDDHGKEITLR